MSMQTPDSQQAACADCGVRFVLLQEGLCEACYATHSAETRARLLATTREPAAPKCWNCHQELAVHGGLCLACQAEQQRLKHP